MRRPAVVVVFPGREQLRLHANATPEVYFQQVLVLAGAGRGNRPGEEGREPFNCGAARGSFLKPDKRALVGPEQGPDQYLVLGGEVVVNGRWRHAGLGGYVRDPGGGETAP